jgi:glucose/arabinose dehydrogenase
VRIRAVASILAGLVMGPASARAGMPPGFAETVLGDSLDSPVSMAIAPDGRVFVCEQGGRVRVIRGGRLLKKPFLTLPVSVGLEEGLLGLAFDPHFTWNRHVFVIYTSGSPVRHEVIVRYTASGDTVIPGSGHTIFELDPHLQHQHVGGALRFGRDGTLYVGTGDNDHEEWAQSLRSSFGKILRIRTDGTIPADNPFAQVAQGVHRAIWARGLRNAFTFDIDPKTGRMYVNDVGGSEYEEVNEGVAGGNYGWPLFEGPSHDPSFLAPVYAYGHARTCAITGGAFYRPARPAFPREWEGRYFFADYCANEISWLDPAAPGIAHLFGTTRIPGPVDLRCGPDGALYYLVRGTSDPIGGDHTSQGLVVRIAWVGNGSKR